GPRRRCGPAWRARSAARHCAPVFSDPRTASGARSAAASRERLQSSPGDGDSHDAAPGRARGACYGAARPRARCGTINMKLLRQLAVFAAAAVSLAAADVNTFSIVAYDPVNSDWGVAVASRYFSVGAVVPWAEAGVGAIATQANVNVGYGP